MSKLKEQILILRSDNKSYNEIAKILGCSKSIVGYYCNDITNSKQRKSTSLWRKRLRRYIEHFQNRGMKSLNKIKTLDIINKFGTKTKCYLTGTPIDLEKDDYCFDHIIPVSKGGSNDLSNLGITTPAANYSKSDLTVEEYLNLCKLVLEHHGYTVNKQ